MICQYCKKKRAIKKFCSQRCYWNSLIGKTTWKKQERINKKCLQCKKIFQVRMGMLEKRKFCSRECVVKYQIGKKYPSRGGKVKVICKQCNKEFIAWRYENRQYCNKKCLGLVNKERMTGKKHWNWKNGISPRSLNTVEYKEWRTGVFKQDKYVCKKCGYDKGRTLNAHHIKNWFDYPNSRFVINNGITLCGKCHSKFHSIYGYRYNSKLQVKSFLSNK